MFSLLVKSDIFLLNASLAMAIFILMSLVQSLPISKIKSLEFNPARNVIPPKANYLKWSISFSTLLHTLVRNDSLLPDTLITFYLSMLIANYWNPLFKTKILIFLLN